MILDTAKFFKTNMIQNATVSASSGPNADFILDEAKHTYWRSKRDTDELLRNEQITVKFDPITVDRLFLIDHNFKNFDVKVFTDDWVPLENVRTYNYSLDIWSSPNFRYRFSYTS